MIVRERNSGRAFLGVVALLFAASASLTIAWCTSMRAMGEMPMPGGWSLSMIWMRIPGQSWAGAAAAFVGMWTVMMVAMMLPSLVPVLLRYRQALGITGTPHAGRTALVVIGYFFIWTLLGTVVFLLGATLAAVEMREAAVARAVPVVSAAVVLIAAAFHITRWMPAFRVSCREARLRGPSSPALAGTATAAAWRYGLRLGLDCGYCCSSLMTILVVAGLMDLRAMAAATIVITVERILPFQPPAGKPRRRYLMTTAP